MADFEYLWRNKWITSEAENIDDMISSFEYHLDLLKQFKAAGLQPEGGIDDDYATFVTDSPELAKKFGFEKTEWDDEEDSEEIEVSLN